MINNVIAFLSAILISLAATAPVVWLLKLLKLGQPVREEGPAAHLAKAGTPTMGGLGFIAAIVILALIMIDLDLHPQYLALVFLFLGFAGIGLIDDLLKITRKQNQGLTFWQKIFAQGAFALVFAMIMVVLGQNLNINGLLANLGFGNAYLYQLLIVVMVVGAANATNLTDGLNGLLAGTAGAAFFFLAFIASKLQVPEAAVFALICSGAALAFLYFNFPKAKVFMGDAGSLALGAALAGLAIILHQELRLIVIGGVFVIEALSVILQVASYKFFKRRIFRMSPLHHHFELLGLSETQVVIGFWLLGIILGVLSVI